MRIYWTFFLLLLTVCLSQLVEAGGKSWSISPQKTIVNESQGAVQFTLTRSNATSAETVYASTREGNGFANRQDFAVAHSKPVRFAAGVYSRQITIRINNDRLAESNETFGLVVRNSAGRSLIAGGATFTISNDDAVARVTSPSALVVAAAPVTFTLASALDTYLRQASATTANGTAEIVSVDGSDGGGAVHGLLYFNVIGSGANQVPPGSTINSATLTLRTTNAGNGGAFHRMLQTWNESSTWSSMTNGIQTNGTEARSTADFSTGAIVTGTRAFDVTSSIAAWAAGESNFGWAIIPLGTNGWDFSSRQGLTAPSLSVTYTPAGGPLPPTVSLTANPTTISAGASTTLTWSSANATACTGTNFSTGGATSGSVSDSPAATTAYSISCTGDGGSASASASVTVETGGGSQSVDVRVAASADDAEESSAGIVNLTSSDLELVLDATAQTVGMRFANIALPRGASITNAYIQFQVDEVSTAAASLTIQGVAADSATAFTTAAGNVSSRLRTTASVAWVPASWPTIDVATAAQRTPNLASIIQEIINRGGWNSGSSLAIIMTGSGKRVAEAFEGVPAAAPLLHIEYSTVADNEAPSVPTGLAGNAVSSTRINLSWNVSTDNIVVAGYKVFRDGATTPIATVSGISHSDAGLTAATAYSYAVSAVDGAGNESAQSSSISISTPPATADNIPPSNPTGLAAAAVSSTQVNLKWNASTDNIGVTGYRVLRDGNQIATPAGTDYFDANVVAGASHTYTVTAVDGAGNVSGASNSASVTTPAANASIVFVGAGDIASVTGTAGQTALVLDQIVTANPSAVIYTLGDNAYQSGSAAEFASYYTPTWGRHKLRTRPAPGNHEYQSAGAQPYYQYFGAAAGDPGKGYYSYELGAWHIVSLNSETNMAVGSPQEVWLRADLAAHPSSCILAYWHKTLFTSGTVDGPTTAVRPLWQALYDYGADVILTSHEHNYERFAPQTPTGVADPARGIRQFVVGTAGGPSSLFPLATPVANSEARNDLDFGVLKLTLNTAGYSWEFVHVAGRTFTDSGSRSCSTNTADNTAPTVPTGVTGNAVSSSQINLGWTASTDEVAVAGYRVYRNGDTIPIASVATTNHSDTGLTADTLYDYTVSAFDAAGNESNKSSPPVAVTTLPVSATVTWEGRVSASADDAEESSAGAVNLTSSDLELVQDATTQTVGMRFANILIPKGATISNAYVQFQVDEISTAAANLTIQGQAADHATAFTTATSNVSSRARTAASVSWAPASWPTINVSGADQRTSNIASIIQEIVNRTGWSSGNALALVVTGSGKRVAEAYDGVVAAAPLLHIDWSTSTSDTTPPTVAMTSPSQNDTLTGVVTITANAGDNEAVQSVQFRLGGSNRCTADTVAPYTCSLDTSFEVNGTAALSAVATDTSGNQATSDSVTVTIDNPPPQGGTIRVPEDYATVQAAINAAVNGNLVLLGPGTYAGGITISGKTITLASYFHTTGDPSYINTTTISGGTIGVNVAANSPNVIVKGLRFTGGADSMKMWGPGGQSISNFFDHAGDDGLSFENIGGIARYNNCVGPGDDCIDVDGPITDLLIENNTLSAANEDGIEIRNMLYAGPLVTITIRGNTLTGNRSDGIQIIDQPDFQNRRFVIETNLIGSNLKAGLGLMDNDATSEDYRAASMTERIHVFNNTFDANNHGISGGDNLIAVNNIISRSTTLGLKNIDAASIVARTLFWNNAQDQVGSNMDLATTISGSPLYTPSFGLGVESPAIDAGTATFTHNGETVLTIPPAGYAGSAPDLGRYESGM